MIFPCSMDPDMMILGASTGMSPPDILRSATLDDARMTGLKGELGSIEEGKLADVTLMAANHLERVERLRG